MISLKLGLRNIWKNRRRSFTTLLAVAIGFTAINLFAGYIHSVYTGIKKIAIHGEALGHLAALRAMARGTGLLTVNLGTGRGYSVLEMIRSFEKASGRKIPYRIGARRPGDIAQCYADPSRARQTLGWHAERDVDAMCADTWRWQRWAVANLSSDQEATA